MGENDAIHFVNEAYKHCKAICTTGDGSEFLNVTAVSADGDKAVVRGDTKYSEAIAAIRDQLAD